jgi:tRNA modification GTPase
MVLLLNDLSRGEDLAYKQAQTQLQQDVWRAMPAQTRMLQVNNKSDTLVHPINADTDAVFISAKTGEGLDHLRQRILALAGWQSGGQEGVFTARVRHLQALQQVQEHLRHALARLEATTPALDLLAEDARMAQQALSGLTGAFSADDLLGEIFASFCIGK